MSQNSVASVTPANSNLESPRQDKSLGVLASKFVELLREQKGILNLKHVSIFLSLNLSSHITLIKFSRF